MAHMVYTPPPIIHQVEETRSYGNPYFYECDGKIINLAAAKEFYVDHFPLTSYYWPSVRIGSTSYHLTASMDTSEKAMEFLRKLAEQIHSESRFSYGQTNPINSVKK